MSDILKRIITRKAQEVADRKTSTPEKMLKDQCTGLPPSRGFCDSLLEIISDGRPAVIAEIKKASPSKGLLRSDFDPVAIAESYFRGGATCLSVITDVDFFQGSDRFLKAVRSNCVLPVIRKDFIIDEYQVFESRVMGADCILLIVAVLESDRLTKLHRLAVQLGMDVLIEVHDKYELEIALSLGNTMIGINNRDLRTFETSLQTTFGLLSSIPDDRLVVTESGICNFEDVQAMRARNVNAFLVGEALMRSQDPGERLQELFAT